MTNESVIAGSAESGRIVCGPEPGMLNEIVSVPAVAFAQLIALRSEPGPLSFVFETMVVQATFTATPGLVPVPLSLSVTDTVTVYVPAAG